MSHSLDVTCDKVNLQAACLGSAVGQDNEDTFWHLQKDTTRASIVLWLSHMLYQIAVSVVSGKM